jgi:hypothetical protein
MAASTALIIESVHINLAPGIGVIYKTELKAAGVRSGMFFIGGVVRMPDTAYLLWHQQGEVPVSIVAPAAAATDPEEARKAVQVFLLRWKNRETK